MIEYLELLGREFGAEIWLVRVDGELGNAQVYYDEDRDWSVNVAASTKKWVGFSHPHVTPIHAIAVDARLVVVTGDERGPTILQMASKLSPEEREQWALSELAGICEAVTTMAWREGGNYIHRRLDHLNMVVGADGHVRLRAPIAELSVGPQRAYTGQPRAIRHSWCMSPEQATGYPLTPASDLFQLAYVAYTALTLKKPFVGQTDFETLVAIKDAVPPPRPETSVPELADVILKNLARLPADRDPSVADLGAQLRALVVEPAPTVIAKVAALRGDPKPAPHQSAAIMGYRCPKQWEELAPTKADGIRHCASCQHEVVRVRSLEALIPLLGKRCVAYEPE